MNGVFDSNKVYKAKVGIEKQPIKTYYYVIQCKIDHFYPVRQTDMTSNYPALNSTSFISQNVCSKTDFILKYKKLDAEVAILFFSRNMFFIISSIILTYIPD
jgi:hypothetical protein